MVDTPASQDGASTKAGLANGPSKSMGLSKFSLNFTGRTVSFFFSKNYLAIKNLFVFSYKQCLNVSQMKKSK